MAQNCYPCSRYILLPITHVAGPDRKELVGERGFEPPTPWSRTKASRNLSASFGIRSQQAVFSLHQLSRTCTEPPPQNIDERLISKWPPNPVISFADSQSGGLKVRFLAHSPNFQWFSSPCAPSALRLEPIPLLCCALGSSHPLPHRLIHSWSFECRRAA